MKSLSPLAALRAALLAAAGMACGCTPTLNWRELPVGAQLCAGPPQAELLPPQGVGAVCGDRGSTEGAKASFPCRPQSDTRTLTLGGRPVQMQLKACEAGQVLWAVTSAQVADATQAPGALVELRRSLVANLAGSDSLVPGTARVHIVGRHEDGSAIWARAVFVSSGRDVYQLVMLPRAGAQPPTEEAQNYFFSGLRFESVKR